MKAFVYLLNLALKSRFNPIVNEMSLCNSQYIKDDDLNCKDCLEIIAISLLT
jgi:hypothetical protein